uniref:hypothetical protein n=1 Tax=Cellvibrio fontiphilus TaxID=1815559 RepID=UPI002B4BF073|nr:hypothetical protein [Cellvibrio fontiphilus]
MRFMKFLSLLGFVFVSSIAINAQANTPVSCSWTYLGGGGAYGSWTSVDGCFIAQPQAAPLLIAQRTRTNTGSCTMTVTSPYVNLGSCTNPSFYLGSASSSSSISSTPAPVCTTTNINIGQSCNGENWCMESFGRACSAAGGSTVWKNGTYVCQKTTCTNP